jgi:hypothetical protein
MDIRAAPSARGVIGNVEPPRAAGSATRSGSRRDVGYSSSSSMCALEEAHHPQQQQQQVQQ